MVSHTHFSLLLRTQLRFHSHRHSSLLLPSFLPPLFLPPSFLCFPPSLPPSLLPSFLFLPSSLPSSFLPSIFLPSFLFLRLPSFLHLLSFHLLRLPSLLRILPFLRFRSHWHGSLLHVVHRFITHTHSPQQRNEMAQIPIQRW